MPGAMVKGGAAVLFAAFLATAAVHGQVCDEGTSGGTCEDRAADEAALLAHRPVKKRRHAPNAMAAPSPPTPCLEKCLKGPGSSQWTYMPEEFFVADYNMKDIHNKRVTDSITPSAVVFANETSHVQVAVNCARKFGKSVYGRSGMNQYEASCADEPGGGGGCVLVDTSNLQQLEWGEGCSDAQSGCTAVLGPGLSLGKAYVNLSQWNYTIPAGTCAQVRVAGLTLGGGKGWLTRKYGMLSDRLAGIDAVLLDGSLVHADEKQEPDLFWLARGGGGNIFPGVVTGFHFNLVPLPANNTPYQYALWESPSASCTARVMAEWYNTMAIYEDENLWSRLAIQNFGTPQLLIKALYAGSDPLARCEALGKLKDVMVAAGCGGTLTEYNMSWLDIVSINNNNATPDEMATVNCGWRLQSGQKPERTDCFGFDTSYSDNWAWRSLFFGEGKSVKQELWDALASTPMWQTENFYVEIDPTNAHAARVPVNATAFPHRCAGLVLLQQVMRGPDASVVDGLIRQSKDLLVQLTQYTPKNAAYYNYLDRNMSAYGANPREAFYGTNAARVEAVLQKYTEGLINNGCDRCQSWELSG